MTKVLITSAGSQNGANVIHALKGLDLVACDVNKYSAGLYLVDKRYIVPRADEEAFIPTIQRICEKESIDYIIPTYSSEYPIFARNRGYFEGKIAVSDHKTYDLADNKLESKRFMESLGIDVPELYPDDFPMIIKPINGSASRGVYKVKDFREYDFYKNDKNFAEKFIEGQEYVVDGVSDLSGKMICALPRIRMEVLGGGAMKCQTVKNEKLVELARTIAEGMKLVGAFNVQCVENNGKFYFFDVNNRFPSGGMPLAVASGMNMPLMIIKMLQGIKPHPHLVYGKIMLRYQHVLIIDEEETNNISL